MKYGEDQYLSIGGDKLKELTNKLNLAVGHFDVEETEEIIEKQLEQNLENVNLWIKLALTVLCVPLVDYDKSLKCIEKVNSIEENNILSLILESCIYHYHLGGIDERLFNKLYSITSEDEEVLSMTRYLMALYYHDSNEYKRKELLEESIKLCNKHVFNYEELGKIYVNWGDINKGKEMLEKAYENIKVVYDVESLYDFTDVNEYIYEYVKGTHASLENKLRIKELIDKQ